MALHFLNLSPLPVSVAIMYYDPIGCSTINADPWRKQGWWNMLPGAKVTVYSGDVKDLNRYWYFFARATDGTTWNGPTSRMVNFGLVFNQCASDDTGMNSPVGFGMLDIGNADDFTEGLAIGV